MVAPIDAKVSFEAEGETFTLRLNFRTLSLARKEGADFLSGMELHPLDIGPAVRCLAIEDHPDLTDDEAFTLVIRHQDAVMGAIEELVKEFGGSTEQVKAGNVKAAPKKRAARKTK